MRAAVKKFVFLIPLVTASLFAQPIYISSDIFLDLINAKTMELFPVTRDYRNYFILQSIGNQTNIIIGDFVGAERKIILIEDRNCDNTIDKVYEFYPDSKPAKRISPSKPSSELFEGLEKMKRDIISGAVYRNNYSYNMHSLDVVERRIAKGTDLSKFNYGYSVKFFDPDKPSTVMSEFFFGRHSGGGYDLQFKTNYNKVISKSIKTPVQHSVYCEASQDPIVKETVEKLIKLVVR